MALLFNSFPFIVTIAFSFSLSLKNVSKQYPLLSLIEGSIIILASITLLFFDLKKEKSFS